MTAGHFFAPADETEYEYSGSEEEEEEHDVGEPRYNLHEVFGVGFYGGDTIMRELDIYMWVYGAKLIETSNNPSPYSSIINVPGESTLRRDFLRLQLANKERSEALRRQQLEQQQNEGHKHQLLAERQKRIEEQKQQRRRLEEVRYSVCAS